MVPNLEKENVRKGSGLEQFLEKLITLNVFPRQEWDERKKLAVQPP